MLCISSFRLIISWRLRSGDSRKDIRVHLMSLRIVILVILMILLERLAGDQKNKKKYKNKCIWIVFHTEEIQCFVKYFLVCKHYDSNKWSVRCEDFVSYTRRGRYSLNNQESVGGTTCLITWFWPPQSLFNQSMQAFQAPCKQLNRQNWSFDADLKIRLQKVNVEQ